MMSTSTKFFTPERFIKIFVFLPIWLLSITLLAESASIEGIYSLMKGMAPVKPSVLKLPFIEGVSIRVSWAEIEPQEGVYNWDYLDKAFKEVNGAKKKAMLRVLPGILTPQWVFDKGAGYIEEDFSTVKELKRRRGRYGDEEKRKSEEKRNFKSNNPRRRKLTGIQKIPIPWDETYIKAWINFVNKLGRRYGSNENLILIHMAGPTVKSAEMHLPKWESGRRRIEDAGYSKDRIVSVWKKVIDAYSDAFSGKALALNIAIPLKRDGALKEVVQYSQSKLGKLFCIQGNWLSARTSNSFYPYKIIYDLKDTDATVGFQMLGAAKNKGRMGSFDTAVQNGLNAGAKYFEIYQIDLFDESNRKILENLADKLRTDK